MPPPQPVGGGGMDINVLGERLRRLVTLDTSVFEEVRTDAASTIPAIVVAAVATLLFGAGGWLWWVFADLPDSGDIFVKSLIVGSILSAVLWAVWLAIVYVILTQVFRARADVNELVRVMGFAAAPLALGILMFIPALEFGIALTAVAIFFGANVVAVQTATDAPAGRVLAANGAGFLIWAIVLGLFVTDENAYAPGIFVFDVGVEYLKNIGDVLS
jgi:hypothetical protein